jgi:hypothetical protein
MAEMSGQLTAGSPVGSAPRRLARSTALLIVVKQSAGYRQIEARCVFIVKMAMVGHALCSC